MSGCVLRVLRYDATRPTFNELMNRILPKLASPGLLNSQGLGNEIGFRILDYPPRKRWPCAPSFTLL